MTRTAFPGRTMRRFVETLSAEIGRETLEAVLSKAGLPGEWADPACFIALDDERSARAYARLQAALRTYYGRGARGILLRIGSRLWEALLADLPLPLKARAALVRSLPVTMRPKAALELLAKALGAAEGDLTVHTLDLDLLLVDQASPTCIDQSSAGPVCFVTLGLVRECLYWADGREHDMEERACRAAGARQCEFKITIGGG